MKWFLALMVCIYVTHTPGLSFRMANFYFLKEKDMGLVFIKGHVCFEILVTEKAKKILHSIAHIFSYLSSAFSASHYENKSTKLEGFGSN